MNDPYTAHARLCDDDGIVRQGAMWHGNDYPCTGHAHFAGEHYRCTSPAHTPTVAWDARTGQRLCAHCGHPVDAPLPWSINTLPGTLTPGCAGGQIPIVTTYTVGGRP